MPHDAAPRPGPRDWRRTRTERLLLDAYAPRDLVALGALHADARVWGHYPRGRHRDEDGRGGRRVVAA